LGDRCRVVEDRSSGLRRDGGHGCIERIEHDERSPFVAARVKSLEVAWEAPARRAFDMDEVQVGTSHDQARDGDGSFIVFLLRE
jgi:hypothetical protein